MRKEKRNSILHPVLIGALVIALIAGSGIGSAWAYFTTYASSKGTMTLHLGDSTDMEEEVVDGEKRVVITADEDSCAVFVRVTAFCGDEYSLAFSGENWSDGGDGFYYYASPIQATESTTQLVIKILDKDGNKVDASTVEEGTAFNIVVVHESTPALYDEDGNATADWDAEVTVNSTEGGN